MHYILYEIKNNINSKVYVGVHKTKVINDGYMGSGKVIKNAIKKHGIENFTKTILETFDSQEAMFSREKEVVNDDFLERKDTYNLRRGGSGGFDYLNKTGLNNSTKTEEQLKTAGVKSHRNRSVAQIEQQKKISSMNLKNAHANGSINYATFGMLGKTHTDDTKIKMKESNLAEKNSQFGTMWITNGTENKKIKKNDSIPGGWNKGRKLSMS